MAAFCISIKLCTTSVHINASNLCTGDPGQKGKHGTKGENGVPGPRGDPGDRGPRGLIGYTIMYLPTHHYHVIQETLDYVDQ